VQGAKTVDCLGRPALVHRHPGQPVATVAICPHLGGPLECAWFKFASSVSRSDV
jgi:nitrite reductase/ring-hydroxylating ferredoxin subunit